ncbi:hypothetical protein EVAR_12375_1 [Eumeta japonica]|uniref:Uncharacterized protein n=1 Tax=Eumeta variegata TaxID=151549 RepID=A0A4C1TZV7_EUMVA|nr:hypothetical protein EVAR_12375_1 [Eumeta japonica]
MGEEIHEELLFAKTLKTDTKEMFRMASVASAVEACPDANENGSLLKIKGFFEQIFVPLSRLRRLALALRVSRPY